MIQGVAVVVLFAGALVYLGWIGYRHFFGKPECETGCGKCSTIDLARIEKEIAKRGL